MSASNEIQSKNSGASRASEVKSDQKAGLQIIGKEAAAIVSKERSHQNLERVVDDGLRSVLGKKHVESGRVETTQRIERERQVRNHRVKTPVEKHHGAHHEHGSGESLEHERMEQINLRRVQTQQSGRSRTGAAASTEEERLDHNTAWSIQEKVPRTRPNAEKEAIPTPTVRGDTSRETDVANKRFGIAEGADPQSDMDIADPGAVASGVVQGLASMQAGPVALATVVGPEAILTFQEKLKEVWVSLDDGALNELDVVARMPATLSGESATELLMVESPQGVHFVAFLRNKNDFEVLANFDRHELLPGNPSRQLIEAAIVAYEQLDAVFKDGSEKIGESVQKATRECRGDDPALVELRMRWNVAKRRKRRFENWIDYLLGELDILDQLLAENKNQGETLSRNAGNKQSGEGNLVRQVEKSEEIEEDTKERGKLAITQLFGSPEADGGDDVIK